MSVIAGLKADNGYLFFTGSIDGAEQNGSIIKLNGFCGSLIVTKRENELKRVQELLGKYSGNNTGDSEGMPENLIRGFASFLKAEFKNNASYKSSPLPFLLIIVGINPTKQNSIEHVFMRNRITEAIEKTNAEDAKRPKEFATVLDIKPLVSDNVFYGESNIIEYLSRLIPHRELTMDTAKLLACVSVSGIQEKEDLHSTSINMAALSAETGFQWITLEETSLLKNKALQINLMLKNGLNSFLSENHLSTFRHSKLPPLNEN